MVAKIIYRRAIEKQREGRIPIFLGLSGMLALMYDKIGKFFDSNDENYILDLAVDALFAVKVSLPQGLDSIIEDTTEQQETTTEEREGEGKGGDESEPESLENLPIPKDDNQQWTPIPPGKRIADVQ